MAQVHEALVVRPAMADQVGRETEFAGRPALGRNPGDETAHRSSRRRCCHALGPDADGVRVVPIRLVDAWRVHNPGAVCVAEPHDDSLRRSAKPLNIDTRSSMQRRNAAAVRGSAV
jgi:hypothetical protein